MQSSLLYSEIKSPVQNPQFPEQLKCPRCDSTNTKFCYYNNYNLSQPRHFCKNCKRYWTKGGALRNVPVGGGSRKKNTKRSSKRPANASNDSRNMTTETLSTEKKGDGDFGGHFGDFSSGEGQAGNSIDGLGDNGFISDQFDYPGLGQTFDPHLGLESGSSDYCDGYLNIPGGGGGGDPGCWSGGSNEWPNFAIYTPGFIQ